MTDLEIKARVNVIERQLQSFAAMAQHAGGGRPFLDQTVDRLRRERAAILAELHERSLVK